MTAAFVLAAALAAAAAAQGPAASSDAAACPAGTRRVATDDPYNPYRCALPGEGSRSNGLSRPDGPAGFTTRPKCPLGTEPLATPHSLQPYRCVRKGAGAAAAAAPGTRYSVAGGLSFATPTGFRVQDDWKDDVPTLYLELESEGAGRPTSITITRVTPGLAGGEALDDAIARDEQWQGARETKPLRVAGAKARATEVPASARTVYLPAGRQSYYAFVYSASDEHYAGRLADFERLLKSVRLGEERP